MDKEYTSDDIQTLSTGDAIRMRPHLYFDKCFSEKTLDSLPFEVLCHAFDEYFDGVCKKIEISVHNDSFVVNYDAGISLESKDGYGGLTKAETIMTQIFACKNEKKHLAVGQEFCSLGMATINFAAERCELMTVCNGKKGFYVFENGITIFKEIDITQTKEELTKILIKPNKQLFEGLTFTFDGINEKAKQINSKLTDLDIRISNNIQVQ
jgi:DNA gyrase/topoisomerase IV subunit B